MQLTCLLTGTAIAAISVSYALLTRLSGYGALFSSWLIVFEKRFRPAGIILIAHQAVHQVG